MAYIVLSIQDGLKYYLQNHKGDIRLNGLKDNAEMFRSEEIAKEIARNYEYRLKSKLFVEEVLPKSN